jgi:hypothetical protein
VRTWRVARLYSVLYSEIALSRKQFGIGHMYIYTFLLRMTDTVTSQNIDLSSLALCIVRDTDCLVISTKKSNGSCYVRYVTSGDINRIEFDPRFYWQCSLKGNVQFTRCRRHNLSIACDWYILLSRNCTFKLNEEWSLLRVRSCDSLYNVISQLGFFPCFPFSL